MYEFELVKPTSLAEAVEALKGEDAQALGGGQTLLPTMKARLAQMETLVSLSHIAKLKYVRRDGDALIVGGGTTHGQVAREGADAYPALASLAARIGDPAVRARGTVGGSLANDDPSACWPAGALGSGATIVATGPNGAREIASDDFFQGMFLTALDEGEIVTEVRFPIPQAATYEKFIQPASRFPLVAAFVARFPDGVRVAITGASQQGVFRWTEAEEALASDFSAEAVKRLTPPDGAGMISDLHGSGDYRAHLVGVMTARAVAAAA
jgi:carbon-monoxide dehydrogenase medium subunit